MSDKSNVEQICELAVGLDASDLVTLVQLRDGLASLEMDFGVSLWGCVRETVEAAIDALDGIVLRIHPAGGDDVAAAFILKAVDFIEQASARADAAEGFDGLAPPVLDMSQAQAGEPEAAPEVETQAEAADGEPEDDAEPDEVEDEEVEAAAPAGAVPAAITDTGERVPFDPGVVGTDEVVEFVTEAREHIANAEEALLVLDTDPTDIEELNKVFRAFHTVKGVAGFMGLTAVGEFTHIAETVLDAVRSGKLELTRGRLDLTLKSCDHLTALMTACEGGESPSLFVHKSLMAALEKALTTDPTPASAAAIPTGRGAKNEESGEDIEPKPGNAKGGANKQRKADQTVKVSTGRMDSLVDMVGELVIAHQMVVQDDAISTIVEQRAQRNLSHVGKIIRDLQEVAMSLRLVTLRSTFQKMAPLVRDLSSKAGKQIEFVMEGEDTELDRNVVEEIADPLVHMVRNACDHGIEGSSERVEAGKAPTGRLVLRAYHQGGSIVVEIQDDGRGLKREKLLQKAIERGIVADEREGAEMSDHDVYQLIFAAGFSTAEKITDVSGRGVGMDVVRRNIEALRGKIEIDSVPGEGSTFRMKLPLTMAIIDGMVVRVGTQRYVVPTLAIEQSFRPKPGQIHTVVGKGEVVKSRGTLLPIHRLNRVLGLNEGADDLDDSLLITLESHSKRCCLMVDEILGQQQVVIKSLGRGVAPVRGVSGGAILGDGRVALILDVASLIGEAELVAA